MLCGFLTDESNIYFCCGGGEGICVRVVTRVVRHTAEWRSLPRCLQLCKLLALRNYSKAWEFPETPPRRTEFVCLTPQLPDRLDAR